MYVRSVENLTNLTSKIIEDRCLEISNKIVIHNQKYKILDEKMIDLINKLSCKYDKEVVCMIENYTNYIDEQYLITEKAIYLQGIKDGKQLGKVILDTNILL